MVGKYNNLLKTNDKSACYVQILDGSFYTMNFNYHNVWKRSMKNHNWTQDADAYIICVKIEFIDRLIFV